jgi:DNA-binding response OmpR family regulator
MGRAWQSPDSAIQLPQDRRIALVVAPDPAKRAAAAVTLRGMGFKTYQTGCGGVGQFMASQLTLDAVVVDVVLPDLDGLQLIRRVRATSPQAVIVATAPVSDDWDAVVADALEAGADFALSNFAGDALRAVLQKAPAPRAGATAPDDTWDRP